MTGQAVIELQNVTKTYGGNYALSNLSITVCEGEWLTLLGPSGCGKTTTLRLIAGFMTPDSGVIRLGGRDVTKLPPEKRGLGMVFQSYALFPHMSVEDNIAFGLRRRHLPRGEIRTRVEESLELVQLSGLGKRKPAQLSGGQQQRVALARAIAIRPTALLLDEPLSNLDAALRDEMRVELRRLQRRLGMTSVFVTHDQEEALVLSDRIAVMNAGECIQVGSPQDVYEQPANEFAARFLRFRNFIAGHEVNRQDGWVDVKLRDNLVIRARAADTTIRGDTRVAIRPERIALSCDGKLAGTVNEVTYLGEHVRCVIYTEVGPLTVSVISSVAPKVGDKVALEIPPLAAQEVP